MGDNLPENVQEAIKDTGVFVAAPTAAGAVIGSIVPVIGTGIGAAAGATIGGATLLVKKIKEKMDK